MRRLLATTALLLAADAAAAAGVSLIDEFRIPAATSFEGTLVGGLSSIDYDPATGRYWAISDDRGDDRPNSGSPRFYELDIDLDASGINDVTFTRVVTLQDETGAPFPNGQSDPESLQRGPDGTFYWSSEGIRQVVGGVDTRNDPFIRGTDLNGAFLGGFQTPDYYGATPDDAGVRTNFGFESLALNADGSKIFTVTENALIQDGPAATFGVPGVTRLGVYDTATGAPTAEYVYLADAPLEAPNPPGATSFSGVVEMLALDDDSFLMLERQFTIGSPTASTGNHLIRIYLAEIMGDTTDVLGVEALAGAAYTPMRKRLVADLNTLVPFLFNVEGLTFVPGVLPDANLLLLNADNNFGANVPQQFIALSVPDAALAPIPLPAAGWLLLAGLGALAGLRRR